ncbi:hypothetical protein NDU88_006324 [Pleurodeles waltl]|uniref:Uncharacterized protein n=1 Tax=Pleurodeles waltl TaxID=8319 RepID=A0AAV7VQ74_PLEWA|nr:hypothetical protein NDU88_006324 [Pleurodeles waltl]
MPLSPMSQASSAAGGEERKPTQGHESTATCPVATQWAFGLALQAVAAPPTSLLPVVAGAQNFCRSRPCLGHREARQSSHSNAQRITQRCHAHRAPATIPQSGLPSGLHRCRLSRCCLNPRAAQHMRQAQLGPPALPTPFRTSGSPGPQAPKLSEPPLIPVMSAVTPAHHSSLP